MPAVVAMYRGVEIYHSRTILCLGAAIQPNQVWYEARLNGWLLIGSLESVRRQIDNMLGPVSEGKKPDQVGPAGT